MNALSPFVARMRELLNTGKLDKNTGNVYNGVWR